MTKTFEKLSNNFCSRDAVAQSPPHPPPHPFPPSQLYSEINTRKCVKQASVEIITWILIYELCGAREIIMIIFIKTSVSRCCYRYLPSLSPALLSKPTISGFNEIKVLMNCYEKGSAVKAHLCSWMNFNHQATHSQHVLFFLLMKLIFYTTRPESVLKRCACCSLANFIIKLYFI